MAAAEEGCDVGVEADRELEELLESKSPWWERPERPGTRTHWRLNELEISRSSGRIPPMVGGEVV